MSTLTNFLKLVKSAANELYEVSVFNANLDKIDAQLKSVDDSLNGVRDEVYPVGSVYLTLNNVDPGTLFGGTWTQIKDRFLLAAGDTYSARQEGGEATHTLSVNEMPTHKHTLKIQGNTAEQWATSTKFTNGSSSQITSYGTGSGGVSITEEGGGQPHNNMPPYYVVYMWWRVS